MKNPTFAEFREVFASLGLITEALLGNVVVSNYTIWEAWKIASTLHEKLVRDSENLAGAGI